MWLNIMINNPPQMNLSPELFGSEYVEVLCHVYNYISYLYLVYINNLYINYIFFMFVIKYLAVKTYLFNVIIKNFFILLLL